MNAIQQALTQTEAQSILATFIGQWETPLGGGFSSDQVIDAYLLGKEHGRTEEQKLLNNIFKRNLKKAADYSEEKYKSLSNIFKIQPVTMKMRILNISSFEVLIVLRKEDYLSDEIEKVYGYLIEEMKGISNADFNWSFILMPSIGELNEDAIESDGFKLNYAGSV